MHVNDIIVFLGGISSDITPKYTIGIIEKIEPCINDIILTVNPFLFCGGFISKFRTYGRNVNVIGHVEPKSFFEIMG